jgi:predicted nucleic acid-binding protein
VIAVDANVLVYAHRIDSPFHDAALTAVTALADGAELWALPWPRRNPAIARCPLRQLDALLAPA